MSPWLRAVSNHLPQLESTILEKHLTLAISEECLNKAIVKKEAHLSLSQSTKSEREKIKEFISHLWKSIREDDTKCKQFIQILDHHDSCHNLVESIRKEEEQYEKESANASLIVSSHPPYVARDSQSQPPIACTEGHKSVKRGSTGFTGWCVSPEDHHNATMEKQQQEAKLREAQKENEKLKAEREEVENAREIAVKDLADLESQLRHKDKELDEMATKRDNLKDSNQILKEKLARLEKRYADKESIKRSIKECEDKIRKLLIEKEKLNDAFEASDQKYQHLLQKKNQLETIAKRHEVIIECLQHKDTHERPYHQQTNRCMAITALILILAVIIGYLLKVRPTL